MSIFYNPDRDLSYNALLYFIIGARGVGKTYGWKVWSINRFFKTGEKFIYLRRLKSQLDQCGKPEGNPFKKINDDTGHDIKPFPSGGIISFREGDKTGELVSVGVALSVVANVRGIDFSDFDYIVFDEYPFVFNGAGVINGSNGKLNPQGMATRADINEGFALNNITSGITAIQQGICDAACDEAFAGTHIAPEEQAGGSV